MNKKLYIVLMTLLLALTVTGRAWYDPNTGTFLARDPLREASNDFPNSYWAFRNQPLDYYDATGGQSVPFNGMGATAQDIGRAHMMGRMMTAGIPYEQAWQGTTPRDAMMEKNSSDALQLYMTMASVGVPVAAPARLLGIAVLDEALMVGGIAGLSQFHANAFGRRPLMSGVPEMAGGGFLLGGGASALLRGGAAVPSLFRSSSPNPEIGMIPGMPPTYAGGPGAMWTGENLSVAAAKELRLPATDATIAGSRTLGYTTPSGNVFLQPGLERAVQASTLRHESVHAFFSPRGTGPIATFRQKLGQWGYDNSQFLRFTEEAIAETYSSGSLSQGLAHPFVNGYNISAGGLLLEGSVYGAAVFGIGYFGCQLEGGN